MMPPWCQLVGLVLTIFVSTTLASHNITIEQKLRDAPDLSQFYSMLEASNVAMTTIQFMPVTIFAPLNSAFQLLRDRTDENLVLYHIANSPHTLSTLGTSVNTLRSGNPPLWITRGKKDTFVNNAKIVQNSLTNFQQHVHGSKKQVLQIIDRVLEPITYTSQDPAYSNPTAYEFLTNAEEIDLGNFRLRSFRQRIQHKDRQNAFKTEGRNTFFIPVDDGFQIYDKIHLRHKKFALQPSPRPEKIDEFVIDGHVIPGHVLFTNPTMDNVEYRTLAFSDKLKVNISFSTERENNHERKYVKSHTIVGDENHPEGVVLAEIVRANIPVKNGVVHLIHRPLMVVDSTVTQFLESFKEKEDGPLYKFYEVIRDVEGDFMDRLTNLRELTLFAPSNAAWKDPSLANVLRDRKRIKEILHMHLVEEKIPLEKIIYNNVNQVPTYAPRKNLYFNIIQIGQNKTLTVEGGGVNATVIQPDIAATNGIVHIIDKVLGVPFTTVGRKLATDPMLNATYILGRSHGFNNQLDDMSKRFTYFVPRDYAWNKMKVTYPSAHKKLFMPDFAYHTKQILERHLVVADKKFSMAELKNLTVYEHKQLPTVRDVVKIKVKESDKSYYIEWNNEWIHVFRPDVECTNGVIHVIDTVLLRESDIQVTGSGESLLPFRVLLGFFLCLFLSQHL